MFPAASRLSLPSCDILPALSPRMSEGSKIFTPYRALGLVSNGIPLAIRYIERRKENLIVTAVGNSFHTYSGNKLILLTVSNPHPSPIVALSADAYHIYTSCDKVIYAWRRGTEIKHKYVGHKADVHLMLPFGPLLISVDRLNNLRVWDIKDESLHLDMEFQSKSFEISAIVHPATYLNKILLGSKQGQLQLWNLKTCKLLYTFAGWDSEVVTMEQAPAQDVIGIGLANGRIILHNLKFDETVVEFKQDWGRVTGISFRTDGFPIMITGSEMGHIAQWDLQERKLASQVRNAHDSAVAGIACFPNEPLMVTNSRDNTVKIWIFDMLDRGGRLLKFRDGHSAPPLSIRFHGSFGGKVITAGEDSCMRIFHKMNNVLSSNLGQASYNRKASKRNKASSEALKMPPITKFTTETTREKSWDSLAAVHRGTPIVTTWSIDKQRMGEHKLLHERFRDKTIRRVTGTCVELSICGNFVIIGYDSGHLDKYNIQSGIYRGTFGTPVAHEDGVRDVVADGLNKFVVSGGENGELKWWKLSTCEEVHKLALEECITRMVLQRDSGLLAIAMEDWSIHIVDVDTQTVVRRLYGHRNQVTDVSFSHDSRWLISSSLDKTVRTWDIPSSACVDCFSVPIPATSLAMSPVGDFLATIHADQLGVYLWSNQGCYHHLSLRPLPQDFEACTVGLPSTAADASHLPPKEGEELEELPKEGEIDDEEYKSPEQISEELVTLALLPTSRWLNLLNLDVIKKKNKPTEVKIPKAAPFFLPTVPGLELKFASEEKTDSDKTKVKVARSFEVLTDFGRKLKAAEYHESLKMLIEMGPSGIEVEIRSLDPDIGGSEDLLLKFLEMIKFALDRNMYFEAVQGYLSLFLKLHAEYVMSNGNVREICETLAGVQGKAWHNVCEEIDQTLSLVSYFKNAALINF